MKTRIFSNWLLVCTMAFLLVACKPFASFTVNPNPVMAGAEATFDASTSAVSPRPRGNAAVAHTWDFGDGETASGVTTQHVFAKAGDYTVKLTVTDSQGRIGETTEIVTVKAAPKPPGPLLPIPTQLWKAPAKKVPASGNYVYLQSTDGDYIGQGEQFTYTASNANLIVAADQGHLSVKVEGDQNWTGDFQTKISLSELQLGYYPNLKRYPFHNTARGGLSWGGEGRGCNQLNGWFSVDNVSYANGALQSIDLRFVQHCEGAKAALRGQIHWTAGEILDPSGPVNPPPANLWRAAAEATPSEGNYIYLESETGDYIGKGTNYLLTPSDSVITLQANGGTLQISASGNTYWTGDFATMESIETLQPGYYGGLQRFPFRNTRMGGLEWTGNGSGCNTLTGWFVIDSVSYTDGALSSIDLRFEQHCEGLQPALHGQIHWTADNLTPASGPVNPPPADLWQPAAGTTPSSGNYIYTESDAGDYIGQGQSQTFTPASATITVSGVDANLNVSVTGDGYSFWWYGNFAAMNSLTQLEPGYYGDLMRYPFHNPVRGGMDWSGSGRGCNTLTGWFVVDNVVYEAGNLKAIDLRFSQNCEGAPEALRGKIHWVN